jgi:hypothetical protein
MVILIPWAFLEEKVEAGKGEEEDGNLRVRK